MQGRNGAGINVSRDKCRTFEFSFFSNKNNPVNLSVIKSLLVNPNDEIRQIDVSLKPVGGDYYNGVTQSVSTSANANIEYPAGGGEWRDLDPLGGLFLESSGEIDDLNIVIDEGSIVIVSGVSCEIVEIDCSSIPAGDVPVVDISTGNTIGNAWSAPNQIAALPVKDFSTGNVVYYAANASTPCRDGLTAVTDAVSGKIIHYIGV